MVLLKDIKGQVNPVRYLSGSLSLGRISASYLFSGPSGVGRALTAKAFLREVLFPKGSNDNMFGDSPEVDKLDRMEHPDVKWIVPEKNKSIGIDEIRQIKDILYMKPFSASSNAAVVEDAHMMTPEAANALLKVLEEPPKNSVIILISDKKELLPMTVLSRCSEVRFGRLPEDIAKRIIMETSGADEKTAGFLARVCQGSVGSALERVDKGFSERQGVLDELMGSLSGRGKDVFMNWHSENKDVLIEDIDTAIVILRDMLFLKEGFTSSMLREDLIAGSRGWHIGKRSAGAVYSAIERLVEIKNALRGNVNPKIAAQALPLSVSW